MKHLFEIHAILKDLQYESEWLESVKTDYINFKLLMRDTKLNYVRYSAEIHYGVLKSDILILPKTNYSDISWVVATFIDVDNYTGLKVCTTDKPESIVNWYEIQVRCNSNKDVYITDEYWKIFALKVNPLAEEIYKFTEDYIELPLTSLNKNNIIDFSLLREPNMSFVIRFMPESQSRRAALCVDSSLFAIDTISKKTGLNISFEMPYREDDIIFKIKEALSKISSLESDYDIYFHRRDENYYEIIAIDCEEVLLKQALQSIGAFSILTRKIETTDPYIYKRKHYGKSNKRKFNLQIPIQSDREESILSLMPDLADIKYISEVNSMFTGNILYLMFWCEGDFMTVGKVLKIINDLNTEYRIKTSYDLLKSHKTVKVRLFPGFEKAIEKVFKDSIRDNDMLHSFKTIGLLNNYLHLDCKDDDIEIESFIRKTLRDIYEILGITEDIHIEIEDKLYIRHLT